MEKRKPHYPLARVQKLIRDGSYRVTQTALYTARRDFAFVRAEQVKSVVLEMTHRNFYKSMTTYVDPRQWQDVYHPEIGGVAAYVKVQILDDNTVVVSFKRREDG